MSSIRTAGPALPPPAPSNGHTEALDCISQQQPLYSGRGVGGRGPELVWLSNPENVAGSYSVAQGAFCLEGGGGGGGLAIECIAQRYVYRQTENETNYIEKRIKR